MQLEFLSADSPQSVAVYVARLIASQLDDHRRVLWLISGGSAVEVAVAAAKQLEGRDLGALTVSLVDERYGAPGHMESNWRQLMEAGFSVPGATLHPVLTGGSQAATADAFEEFLSKEFDAGGYHIGLLGIGPDGHTSGILPHSPAVSAPGYVCAYDGGQYQRVTTTARALKHLGEAVVYAVGEAKWPQLDALEEALSIADQPAQILKTVPKTTIFTDRPLSA